jgi:hypothetical protein
MKADGGRLEDQTVGGHYLDKGPYASAGNGGIGREENGRGNDDGGNMPHEHIARAGKGRGNHRRGSTNGVGEIAAKPPGSTS